MTIQHKTFLKPGRVPRSDELVVGQLAINAADGKLFIELLDGSVICVGVDIGGFVSQETLSAALLAFQSATNEALATKANTSHTHEIAHIGTLSDLLNGKANQADMTAALNQKANADHTHPTTAIAWGAPGAIGATTPNSGRFTTLTITSNANTVSTTTGAFFCLGGAVISRNTIIQGQLSVYDAFRHSGASIGFLGATPIARPTVSGSRGGNAALLSLTTALKNLGLIIDSTTA
ncbi:hypothetical protein ACKFKG_03180 [Phormidesmis sp. 146-35]